MKKLISVILGSIFVMSASFAAPPAKVDTGNAANPTPVEMDTKKPPFATLGIHYCKTKVLLWIILQNGTVLRITEHDLPESEADLDKLLAWIKLAPVDIVNMKCSVDT